LIWVNWENAFDTIGLHLSNPTNPVVAGLLGPTVSDQFPFHWRNSLSFRLGYEFFYNSDSVLRAGYVYNLNQVPSGTLTPYVPAILEHGISVGWGRTWESWSLDLAYQFSFGPSRIVGQSDLVGGPLGGDFDNSVFDAKAHWFAVAFTRRY
jgi:long-subunit fatty acid transport protein